jgi:inositol 3-alpha-galactosyltransferase
MQREDIKMLVKKWWDVYSDESLDYKKGPGAADGEALSEACTIQYVTAPSAA